MALRLVVASLLIVSACTEIGESPFTNRTFPQIPDVSGDASDVCLVFVAVFDPYCASCHSSALASGELVLTPDSVGALAGRASATVAGETLVVENDPLASLLYRKVVGPPLLAGHEGARMPVTGPLVPEAAVDVLRQWIEAGAPGCGATDEPYEPPPPPPIEPGGEIVYGSAPSGFSQTRPSWTAPGVCKANQWWRHPDDEEESFLMHPGEDCIRCHAESDDEDAPTFRFAGTVFDDLRAADNCRGVPGVTVQILDGENNLIGATETNAAGNFGIEARDLADPGQFRVVLEYAGRRREMAGHQATPGACNRCHTVDGAEGAPGRVVAP